MNAAHVHLLLNHLPVIGGVIATLLLLYAILRNSAELTRVVLGMLVLVALAAGVVYLTGEGAEEVVEEMAGVSHDLIEVHEDTARLATILQVALGAMALSVLLMYRRRADGVPRALSRVLLVASFVASAFIGYAAHLGGRIRHPEIRPDFTASQLETSPAETSPMETETDDP